MSLSQKCQYALRAVFELTARQGRGPTKIAEIAAAQSIPVRFLELILGELKHGGFVESRRGMRGGYLLRAPAHKLTVGRIIHFVDGPIAPVDFVGGTSQTDWDPVFVDMWGRVNEAVTQFYENTTFGDLLDQQAARNRNATNYCI